MAHELSGNDGYISSTDIRDYHVLFHSDNTSVVSFIKSHALCSWHTKYSFGSRIS